MPPTVLLRWSHLKEVTKSLSAVSAGLQKERRWASFNSTDAATFLEGSNPESSHPFLLSSSCVSTTSSSVWRASTRQLATAELQNAESGLTEKKNDKKIKTDKSKHIPCRDVCSHPSLHRGKKASHSSHFTNKQRAQTQRDERIYAHVHQDGARQRDQDVTCAICGRVCYKMPLSVCMYLCVWCT